MKRFYGLFIWFAIFIASLLVFNEVYAIGSTDKTIYAETLTSKKTNQKVTVEGNGAGGVKIGSYTGYIKGIAGDLTSDSSVPVGDLSGILPISSGGTGSSVISFVDLASDQSIDGRKSFIKIVVDNTSDASRPFPSMTETERDNIASPQEGDTIFNTTSSQLNIYASSAWGAVAGSGGGDESTDVANISGILPIEKGGTGVGFKYFLDLSTDQTVDGIKTFAKILVDSSDDASKPYPSMATEQRDSISSPLEGSIIYNTSDDALNIYTNGAWAAVGGGGGGASGASLVFKDQQNNGVGAVDTMVGGSYVTRTLNVKVGSATWGSLSSSQITLDSGTYAVYASAPCYNCNYQKIQWYNTTDSTADAYGQVGFERNFGSPSVNNVELVYVFTIASTKTFEVRHYVSTAGSGGLDVPDGFVDVYTHVLITRFQ